MEDKTARALPHSLIVMPKNNKPKGTGRKKIEIKKIEKNSSRKVAFSKRRKGMFKKAGELCRLSEAEIAIIVFSPKGRLFSFGDHVVDKFLADNKDELELDMMDEEDNDDETYWWWEQSIEEMDLKVIEKFKSCLEELRYNVSLKVEEMVVRRTCERDFLGVSIQA